MVKNGFTIKLSQMKKLIPIVLIAIVITMQAQPVYVDRIGFKLESIG